MSQHNGIVRDPVIPGEYTNADIELLLQQLETETENAEKLFEESKQHSFMARRVDWMYGIVCILAVVMIGAIWLLLLHKISIMTAWIVLGPTMVVGSLGLHTINSNENKLRKEFRERYPSEAKLLWK